MAEEYFGMVRWNEDDLRNALEENDVRPTDERVAQLRKLCEHTDFEDAIVCAGWDIIYSYINNGRINTTRFSADEIDRAAVSKNPHGMVALAERGNYAAAYRKRGIFENIFHVFSVYHYVLYIRHSERHRERKRVAVAERAVTVVNLHRRISIESKCGGFTVFETYSEIVFVAADKR